MKFLPYENYYLTTNLPPEEVSARLRGNIIPRSRDLFRFNRKTTRPFEGFIEYFHFEFSPIIAYRNSFLPNIIGQIYSEGAGSRIHVIMKMHRFVTLFVFVWMGGVRFGFIALIISMLQTKTFTPVIFIAVAMLLFGYLLSVGGFKYESRKTKQFLVTLLQAKPVNSNAS